MTHCLVIIYSESQCEAWDSTLTKFSFSSTDKIVSRPTKIEKGFLDFFNLSVLSTDTVYFYQFTPSVFFSVKSGIYQSYELNERDGSLW